MASQEERVPFLTLRSTLLCGAMLVLGWGCTASSEMPGSGTGGNGVGTGGTTAGTGGTTAGTGGSDATGGSSGTGGTSAGTGGTTSGSGGGGPTDGPMGATGGSSGGDASVGGDPDALPPLMECTKPSIDRIEYFGASGEGTTVPMSGTLLVKDGNRYIAKQTYVNNEWHVTEVLIGNTFNMKGIDLSTSKGFWLTWSATNPLWIQMRPGFHYSGGGQWVLALPTTAGQVKTQYFSLDASAWSNKGPTGAASWTYEMARAAVLGFVFVGDKPNTITISGLRFDGYTPVCM